MSHRCRVYFIGDEAGEQGQTGGENKYGGEWYEAYNAGLHAAPHSEAIVCVMTCVQEPRLLR